MRTWRSRGTSVAPWLVPAENSPEAITRIVTAPLRGLLAGNRVRRIHTLPVMTGPPPGSDEHLLALVESAPEYAGHAPLCVLGTFTAKTGGGCLRAALATGPLCSGRVPGMARATDRGEPAGTRRQGISGIDRFEAALKR